MVESNATQTRNISVSSKSTNALLIAVIGALASLGVAYLTNKPDTSDRYYGYQGTAAERRIGIIEEWVRQHTIFGWEKTVSNGERFVALEKDVKRALDISNECMEKAK